MDTSAFYLSPWCGILGFALALFLGKQLGVMARAAGWFGIVGPPRCVGWQQRDGPAFLAGIGFTVSLFAVSLAVVEPGAAAATKVSILLGSMASAIVGVSMLWKRLRPGKKGPGITTGSLNPAVENMAGSFDALAPSWDRKHGLVGLRRLALALKACARSTSGGSI